MSHESLWSFFALFLAMAAIPVARGQAGDAHDEPRPHSSGRKYVESGEQLVVEVYVRDVKKSLAFYKSLGFKVLRKEPEFAELAWEDSRLFLEQIAGQPAPPETLVTNIRIMVPDVDRYWKQCEAMKLSVVKKIADRYYGLRDFTVVSPDGIGLRFASRLERKRNAAH